MTDDLIQEMIDPERPQGDMPRRRRLTATITIIALALLGITSLTTGAIFTDTETATGDMNSGTVAITLAPTAPATLTLNAGNMAPGDVVIAPLKVTNDGSLELRYAITASSTAVTGTGTGDLRSQLTLDVFAQGTAADCSGVTSTSTPINAPGPINWATPTPIVGDPLTGPSTGDRTLVTGGSELLCVQLTMALGADNTYQDTGAQLQLRFDAEQTVNNS